MDPPIEYPAYDGDLAFTSSACSGSKIEQPRQTYSLSFSPSRSFSFQQQIDTEDNDFPRRRPVRVSGDVVFRRDGAESSSLTLETIVNDESISVGVEYDDERQAMVVTTPASLPWDDKVTAPCIALRVTVWAPAGAQLDTLNVNNVHLGIKLLDNLSVRVAREVSLSTIVGQISAATSGDEDNQKLIHDGAPASFALDARSIDVRTTAAPIRGSWPLYDRLSLASTSGDIAAGIEPRPARPDAEEPAALFLRTTSGDIEAWEPVHAAQAAFAAQLGGAEAAAARKPEALVPPRNYLTTVHSTSGTVRGALAFTRAAQVEGVSGNVALDLLPVLPAALAGGGGDASSLVTSTISGATVVRLLKPLWVDDSARFVAAPPAGLAAARGAVGAEAAPGSVEEEARRGIASFLRVLSSRHISTSAAIHVEYPGAWEGGIELASHTGDLEVAGRDVRVIRRDGRWPGVNKRVVARKGNVEDNQGSQLHAQTTSGNIEVLFPS